MFEMCVKHDLLLYASYFKGTNWMYRMETTNSASTCTFVSFQSEHLGLEDSVKMAFLDRLMNTAAFFELRTKQQLGYGVSMYSRGEMESSGNLFIIYVQGERDPNYVEDKINGFLLQYRVSILYIPFFSFLRGKTLFFVEGFFQYSLF
jgi:secreted Zn-dependent insulinase-like peptidase